MSKPNYPCAISFICNYVAYRRYLSLQRYFEKECHHSYHNWSSKQHNFLMLDLLISSEQITVLTGFATKNDEGTEWVSTVEMPWGEERLTNAMMQHIVFASNKSSTDCSRQYWLKHRNVNCDYAGLFSHEPAGFLYCTSQPGVYPGVDVLLADRTLPCSRSLF